MVHTKVTKKSYIAFLNIRKKLSNLNYLRREKTRFIRRVEKVYTSRDSLSESPEKLYGLLQM